MLDVRRPLGRAPPPEACGEVARFRVATQVTDDSMRGEVLGHLVACDSTKDGGGDTASRRFLRLSCLWEQGVTF